MADDIDDLDSRLLGLEELLARAATGELGRVEVHGNDALSAVELGVNMVLDSLEAEIENTREANRALDDKVRERTSQLQARLDELTGRDRLIDRQREAIRELSTPVLELWRHVVAMPIIGVVDSQRGQEITERLLGAIDAKQARFAILDITGVELVDTDTARHLTHVVEAAQLLGTRCIVSGVQPEVALTLAAFGSDLLPMTTARNLERALLSCLRAMAEEGQPRAKR